jgi:hypothetical protein
MKSIKYITLSIALTMCFICNAQTKKQKKTLEQKSAEMTAELAKELKLTKPQKEKVKAIYLDYLKEKEVLEAKIDALKKARKEKINNLLTDEQKKKQEALKKKKKK